MPTVERLDRESRRFASADELAGFLRRQLWIAPGTPADDRFRAALDPLLVTDADGLVGLVDQQPLPIGHRGVGARRGAVIRGRPATG